MSPSELQCIDVVVRGFFLFPRFLLPYFEMHLHPTPVLIHSFRSDRQRNLFSYYASTLLNMDEASMHLITI